ncbi:hypothetical protein HOF65_06055, partial [bacterium]|nr:hypothetical protein [bacterium]
PKLNLIINQDGIVNVFHDVMVVGHTTNIVRSDLSVHAVDVMASDIILYTSS